MMRRIATIAGAVIIGFVIGQHGTTTINENAPTCWNELEANGIDVSLYCGAIAQSHNDGFIGFIAAVGPGATIGATPVPPLDCEEDEIITFRRYGPPPYPLVCYQVDVFLESEGS